MSHKLGFFIILVEALYVNATTNKKDFHPTEKTTRSSNLNSAMRQMRQTEESMNRGIERKNHGRRDRSAKFSNAKSSVNHMNKLSGESINRIKKDQIQRVPIGVGTVVDNKEIIRILERMQAINFETSKLKMIELHKKLRLSRLIVNKNDSGSIFIPLVHHSGIGKITGSNCAWFSKLINSVMSRDSIKRAIFDRFHHDKIAKINRALPGENILKILNSELSSYQNSCGKLIDKDVSLRIFNKVDWADLLEICVFISGDIFLFDTIRIGEIVVVLHLIENYTRESQISRDIGCNPGSFEDVNCPVSPGFDQENAFDRSTLSDNSDLTRRTDNEDENSVEENVISVKSWKAAISNTAFDDLVITRSESCPELNGRTSSFTPGYISGSPNLLRRSSSYGDLRKNLFVNEMREDKILPEFTLDMSSTKSETADIEYKFPFSAEKLGLLSRSASCPGLFCNRDYTAPRDHEPEYIMKYWYKLALKSEDDLKSLLH